MMAKHTPGPWTRYVSRNSAATCTRVGAGDYGAIAECAHMRPDPKENAANARLISAAPDLLAALNAAENLLGEYETEPDTGLHDLLAQVCAAIAKAEGN